MRVIERDGGIEITDLPDFDPERTFECGQCFRWNAGEGGVYTGVALGRALQVRRAGDSVYMSCALRDFNDIWRDYFDLDRDYAAIREKLAINEHMRAASAFGEGIRILHQDKWEALCSFIISQCNNIPRIKKIVEALCRAFGEPFAFEGATCYTFPPAERVAPLSEKDLAPLRCGYRAAYMIEAARRVASGEVDLDALASGEPSTALAALKRINGVGDKVASCAVLFGLHMLDSFPIDTWMKKAIREQYGDGFDPQIFSPYAGIAQQYIFYYARSGRK